MTSNKSDASMPASPGSAFNRMMEWFGLAAHRLPTVPVPV